MSSSATCWLGTSISQCSINVELITAWFCSFQFFAMLQMENTQMPLQIVKYSLAIVMSYVLFTSKVRGRGSLSHLVNSCLNAQYQGQISQNQRWGLHIWGKDQVLGLRGQGPGFLGHGQELSHQMHTESIWDFKYQFVYWDQTTSRLCSSIQKDMVPPTCQIQ